MYTHAARSGDLADMHRAMRAKDVQRKKEKAQAKSESVLVSHPDDPSEKQAEHIARKVTEGGDAKIHPMPQVASSAVHANQEGEHVSASHEFMEQLHGSKGSGSSLPGPVQRDMGSKMGADFSEVKVHTGDKAHAMSESINARAFTHGQDIYFKSGNYNPSSTQGKELLAHELVHTQQQKGVAQRKIQRGFWGNVWEGIKTVANVVYTESGIKSIVDTGKDIYHYYADSPQQFQKYMQAKLKGQIDELTAAKNPSAKFYVAYYAMKGIAIAMNPLALFIMPSVDSLWSIYVKGKLGYYTYLYNLGNKYIEKENAQTGKTETVQNKDYKAGGYAEVFGNQMKNMINPMFLWGEIKGIFKGIGNWFVDLWEMIKFLGKMFWGGITDTWDLLVHQKPPSWMESIAKGASSAGKWFNENGKAVMSELGKLLGDPEKLRSTVKDLKAALKTGAEGLAYSAGEGIAGIQVKVMSMSAEAQGEMFGKVIGYLIPEIVIAVFSDTIVNWLKGGVKALQAFWKTVQASRAMAKIFEGARWVVQMFEKLGLMFKRIGGTMGRMFDEVMEFFRGIMKWEKEVPKSPIRKISLRQQYLGKTPGKFSKTGREVIERMRNEVPPKIRTDFNGKLEFMASDKKWYSIEEADMSHLTDAVTWWNKTGRNFGAKSPEIRNWMLDSKNYVLDHFSINRSAGARLGETYLPPLK